MRNTDKMSVEQLKEYISELQDKIDMQDDCLAVEIAESIYVHRVAETDFELDYDNFAKQALKAGHAFARARTRYYRRRSKKHRY